jgi:ferredoxin-NADP reductase
MPVGSFVYQRSSRPAVFVATGTGTTPFVPMFAAGRNNGRLFFGCRTKVYALTFRYVQDDVETQMSVSRERLSGQAATRRSVSYREGHVTEAILEQIEMGAIAPRTTDFYLCGNPDMVQEVRAMLFDRGARHVYQEAY